MSKNIARIFAAVSFTAFFASLLLPCQAVAAQAKLKSKALLIMLDGLRADAFDNIPMPNLEKLRAGQWQSGYKCAFSVTGWNLSDARPSSAANHAAIATGVTAAKTKVYGNGQTKDGNFAEWPSWLARLATSPQKYKTLYVYSWDENKDTAKHPAVTFHHGSDAANGAFLANLLATAEAPDATMLFIDLPDHGGHSEGFYPHSSKYQETIIQSDDIIGKLLTSIQNRPTFAEEDWLILITSDHGGYAKSHGMNGSTANTIPVLVVGRNVVQGIIPGVPRNYDLAVTALAHFGIDVKPLNLDGRVLGTTTSNLPKRPLTDGLVAYLPFETEPAANFASQDIAIEKIGGKIQSGIDDGKIGKCLRIPGGENIRECLVLKGTEKLQLENSNNFTFTLWARLPNEQLGDPAIFCNKNWKDGRQAGFVLCGACKTESVKKLGVCLNYGCQGDATRSDMGTFDIDVEQWTFYAVSITPEGTVCFCQGKADGHFYWMVKDAKNAVINSGKTWNIGQDGTTNYRFNVQADIDEFALWNRGLSIPEIRSIFDAGKQGKPLSTLLNGF